MYIQKDIEFPLFRVLTLKEYTAFSWKPSYFNAPPLFFLGTLHVASRSPLLPISYLLDTLGWHMG